MCPRTVRSEAIQLAWAAEVLGSASTSRARGPLVLIHNTAAAATASSSGTAMSPTQRLRLSDRSHASRSSRLSGEAVGLIPVGSRSLARLSSAGVAWGADPDGTASTAARSSSALAKRRSRSLAMARITSESTSRESPSSGLRFDGLSSSSVKCCVSTATGVAPVNGCSPVSSRYMTAPSE